MAAAAAAGHRYSSRYLRKSRGHTEIKEDKNVNKAHVHEIVHDMLRVMHVHDNKITHSRKASQKR
jgi:hypothetical protein